MTSRKLANVLIRLSGFLGLLYVLPSFVYGLVKGACERGVEPTNMVLWPAIMVRGILMYGILFSLIFCSQFIANRLFRDEKEEG